MELKDSIPFQLEFRRNYYQLQPRNLPNAKKEHLKNRNFHASSLHPITK